MNAIRLGFFVCAAAALTTLVPGQFAQAQQPPFQEVLGDAQATEGMIKLYSKGGRVFADLQPQHFNRDLIVLISIAKGIGQGDILGGMTWGFGDDWLWQFRKVDDQVHVVRRNVRFTANPGSPEAHAVGLAYTDSVLFALPVVTTSPSGGTVVDLTPIFKSDLPQISSQLPGFYFDGGRSTWAAVKGFPENIELEVAATYGSGGDAQIETVADSRGVTVNVHYSLSFLPQTGYQPRLADDRIGYFLTAIKDYSKQGDDDRFVRYINRWDLRKKDPAAEKSPPEKPVIFYLEKTIPVKYRKAIHDGIQEWSKAFEKAGFYDAVQVRQQEDNADWDPEDIRYSTFRWITASAGFAMGPSRVNPTTGQILDADIIFDADFIESWKMEYENFTPDAIAQITGGALDLESYRREQQALRAGAPLCNCGSCQALHHGMARELALGSALILSREGVSARSQEMEDRLIQQGLKEVTMHEVGHTLGLRHNFKASAHLTLEQINDPNVTKDVGLTASVMDYSPANLVPAGVVQGDYYSTTIGPYDMWAIEYGYKPFPGGTEGEVVELQKIAARCTEPGLAYSTDEDTRGIDSDPLSNRFDLSADTVAYARQRAQLVGEMLPGLLDRVVQPGEGYQKARRSFGLLLGTYGSAMHMASRNIGGVYVNRAHKGDGPTAVPFTIVPADKQQEALNLLIENVFNDKPFQFPPELYNHMATSRWNHWGVNLADRQDFAVHDVIAMWQDRILQQVFSSLTLTRLHDSELKIPADQPAFTAADLVQQLTRAVFVELEQAPAGEYTNRKPFVSSLRRNLQRQYVRRLSNLAMGNAGAPEDVQTVAYVELMGLETKLNAALETAAAAGVKLDAYTNAHLVESKTRIRKALDAELFLSAP
jgi:hypothetical protein